jgi:glycosyltransferase involved in cell wall biosynthesis
MLKTTWRVLNAALHEKADLYHLHDPELIPVGLVLRLFGKRVVYDVHEELPKQIMSKYWIRPWLRYWLAKLADAAESISARTFDAVVAATPAIAARFPESKAIVVQNFPILEELTIGERAPYAERSFRIACIGGITEIRGIKEIVRAMTMIPQKLDAKLLLAGIIAPPELENELKAMPGWDRVNFLGWQSRDGVARALGESRVGSVLLHPQPNYLESYPIKLFEYMSVGIPVVASDFPLWREIVQGTGCGILVDPLNPKAIADAIQWLLEHPKESESMGLRGQQAVRSRFNWNSEAKKLLHVYRLILNPLTYTESVIN